MNNPVSDNPKATIDQTDVFSEGEVSLDEASDVVENLSEGKVKVVYDGPGAFEASREVSPQNASTVLDTAMKFSPDFDLDDRIDREEKLENMGFDNSHYGSGSIVQEILEGNAQRGEESPLYLMASSPETGAEYAVIAEKIDPAIRSTVEDLESQLILEGNLAGNPEGPEDVQEYARTVGGELSEAYQTVADLE